MLKRGSIFFLVLLLVSLSVSAVCSPPGSGDWVVTATQDCSLQDIYLNGNLNITGSGILILNSSNLTLNSQTDREYNIFVRNTGNFTSLSSRMWRNDSTFDVEAYNTATLFIQDSSFQNGTRITFNDDVVSIFNNVNVSDDIFAKGSSVNTFHNIDLGQFEENGLVTVFSFIDNSTSLLNNSVVRGNIDFGDTDAGDSSTTNIYNSTLSNSSDFRGGAIVKFITNSTLNYVALYSGSTTLNGSVTFLTSLPQFFFSTIHQRFYPVYVTDQYALPVSGAVVNITNSSGVKIWEGTTDSYGFVEANVNFTTSNYNLDFNISVNSIEALGLQTNTPVYLTKNVSSLVPEFSDYALLLALVLTISGFAAIRKKS